MTKEEKGGKGEKGGSCKLALELANRLCGDRKIAELDDGSTAISIPKEVIEEVKEKAGNPGSIEERMKVLRELDWSQNWARGMCELTHPNWNTLSEEEKKRCINSMLRILAERAF